MTLKFHTHISDKGDRYVAMVTKNMFIALTEERMLSVRFESTINGSTACTLAYATKVKPSI